MKVMNKINIKSRIPKFKNRQEEAKFFDSHDMADFQDEFKTVRANFSQNLSAGVTIRLDEKTLNKLRDKAHQKGVGPTTLARMWLLEKLQSI